MAVKKRKERARKEPEGQMSMLNTNTITTKDGVIRNIDKETHPKYAWAKTDEPGKLAYINKNILNVDSSYQRTLRDNTRLFIARNFSWAAFGVLSVANRSDGSLYVFDGQHRLAAAMERPSITQVPCVVFNVADDIAFEAEMFLKANRNRKPVLALETYKADIVAGDPIVKKVQALLSAHNYVVSAIPGGEGVRTIRCISQLKQFVRLMPNELETMFPLVVEIAQGGYIEHRLLAGVVYCEYRLRKVGLNLKPYRRKLVEAGREAVLREIHRTVEYRRVGGMSSWAEGVLNVVNHRLRNKISFDATTEAPEADVGDEE
jgi:hypothetical protein